MIPALLAILSSQLIGEIASRSLALPLPGPVLGMVLMVAALQWVPGLAQKIRPVAQSILGQMSLLFVPAGVGVVGHLAIFGSTGIPLLLAIVVSTGFAIAIGALTFAGVARATGNSDD